VRLQLDAVREERALADAIEMERRERLGPRDSNGARFTYMLQCRQCDAPVCSSNDVRVIHNTHYVCVDVDFWTRHQLTVADEIK
jgi:hypothetical protein